MFPIDAAIPKTFWRVGRKRPLLCLGNRHGKTCPGEWLQCLRDCFVESFEPDEKEASLNRPFAGGYIVKPYFKLVPWTQIEMSRALYQEYPCRFDQTRMSMNRARLEYPRGRFEQALETFFERTPAA